MEDKLIINSILHHEDGNIILSGTRTWNVGLHVRSENRQIEIPWRLVKHLAEVLSQETDKGK